MKINNSSKFLKILAASLAAAVLFAGCQSAPAGDGSSTPGNQSADILKSAAYGSAQDEGRNGISVSGQGTVTVKPDVAIITLGVEKTDADAAKARKANNEAMDKVLAAVKAQGVAADDIQTTNFNIFPVYDEKGQKITGYRVYNTVSVKVKKLDTLGAVLTAATDAGANTSYGVSFDVLDRTAAYNEALAQAMGKAKARADKMAETLGVKIGTVLSISESSSYSGPVRGMPEEQMDSAKGINVPTASGQLDVTASVSVVYEIVK